MPACHAGYLHQSDAGPDLLWGATFRIVMDFLHIVFRFTPPEIKSLPVLPWELDENYFQTLPLLNRQ
jgi:hypothetical protein